MIEIYETGYLAWDNCVASEPIDDFRQIDKKLLDETGNEASHVILPDDYYIWLVENPNINTIYEGLLSTVPSIGIDTAKQTIVRAFNNCKISYDKNIETPIIGNYYKSYQIMFST